MEGDEPFNFWPMPKQEGPYSRKEGERTFGDEEVVTGKAWRYESRVFNGDDHLSVYKQMEAGISNFDKKKVESGFTTNKRDFVPRSEGIDILARMGKTIDKM